jgi:hypothetical protein
VHGNPPQGVGAGEPRRLAREELRQGGAVEPDRFGEGGARNAAPLDKHLQAFTKDRAELALIHQGGIRCESAAFVYLEHQLR